MSGMTTASDTLAAFVAVLADTLDEPGTSAATLAARLHLSRYHADRIVASVAGEPPAALRRRILLERAAYRLVTTRDTVLDIAVGAGYGSNEAFTRAFHRAFGVSPSSFRRRPGRIYLPSTSHIHFHPPAGIRLPAQRKVSAMDLLTRMVEHHVWLVGEMIERAATLPEDRLDECVGLDVDDDVQSIRSLLSRLVGQLGMWNAAIGQYDYDWSVEDHESVLSLRARLAVDGPKYLAEVRRVVAAEELDETFVDALCDPAEVFTYGGMIAHVLTFAAHRRTLVALALDKAGVGDLGWGDPMRWVAS